MVTAVRVVDLLDSSTRSSMGLPPFGRPYILVFLNITDATNLLEPDTENRSQLCSLLSRVKESIDENGTLVVALEDMRQDYRRLRSENE